ncbi:MFS family permease [Thermocatellispora tengchongensis]|uniref:MFS family permease n=1 Tax=Thermocatellispora tengchongensis TaxID=1073253 RepID=A0A840NZ97_9ACTN|nr:MFS transporter [Thermocatellispora tengchongensis]MBB5132472.1 MFS family permease [Thermocatellispora tengchongensis]
MEAAARFRDVFAVREFRVLFGGFALLVIGEQVKMLALSVLVYARTGSAGLSALAYMAGWLPYLAGGTLLLALADRLPPRGLMVAGELTRLVVCLALAFAGLPIWAMLALVLVTGLFAPVFGAVRNAVLPDLLPGDAFVLGRSLLGVTSASAQIAGLAVGGAFIALTGPEGALAGTAALSGVAAVVLRLGLPGLPARGERRAGTVRATLRGNRELLGDRRVRGLLLAQWLPVLFLAGAEAMFVPYLTGAASAALAAAAAGMAAGEFAVGRFARPALRERLAFPLAAALGLPLTLFALRPGPVAAAALAALAAACLGYNLGLQRRFVDAVPERVRGQAFGVASAGLMTGQAVGAALVGVLAELTTPHHAIALSGLGAVAAALALRRHLTPVREGVESVGAAH